MKSINLAHQPATQRVLVVLCLSRLLRSCGRRQEPSLGFWPTPANGHSGLAAVACWPPHPEPLTLICTHGPTKLPRTTIRFVRPPTNVLYLVSNWCAISGAISQGLPQSGTIRLAAQPNACRTGFTQLLRNSSTFVSNRSISAPGLRISVLYQDSLTPQH